MSTRTLRAPVGLQGTAGQAALLLAFVVLSNAPFWLLGRWYFQSRPLINLDALLAAALAPWSAVAAVLALMLAWLCDALVSQSLVFHFDSPLEFLSSIRFAQALDLSGLVGGRRALVILPFLACGLACAWCLRRVLRPWAALALCAVLMLADVLNGSSMLGARDTRWLSGTLAGNLAGSPALTTLRIGMASGRSASLQTLPAGESVLDALGLEHWLAAHPGTPLLFVIVEGLGLHRSPELRAWLTSRLGTGAHLPGYEMRTGSVPFEGTTTDGELRSLCRLRGSYRAMNAQAGAACLPAVLAAQGYVTVGLHGFSRGMFDRARWWPMLGLQQTLFAEDLIGAETPRCGTAFRGACDTQLVQLARARLASPYTFVYLLTLNTHLPLEPTPLPADLEALCRAHDTGAEVCLLIAQHAAVLDALQGALAALQQHPPALVVLGDHAPPFAGRKARLQFDRHRVPWLALLPSARGLTPQPAP